MDALYPPGLLGRVSVDFHHRHYPCGTDCEIEPNPEEHAMIDCTRSWIETQDQLGVFFHVLILLLGTLH